MAAISSSVGTQAVTQAAYQRFKVQQARQNAQQAEEVARALEAKAAAAQREAVRADENARSLTVQSNEARSVAGQARQGLAMIRSVGEMQARIVNTATQVSEKQETVQAQVQTPKPVVNDAGQVTGTMVNTTA